MCTPRPDYNCALPHGCITMQVRETRDREPQITISSRGDMRFFFGKVVIVAASSTGIGRQTAIIFAEKGAKVVITGRNSEALEETKRLCICAGATEEDVLELIRDLTEAAFLDSIVPKTKKEFQQGRYSVDDTNTIGKPVIGMSEWDAMLNLNTQAFVRLTLDVVPHLQQTRGAIVNVSPIGSTNGLRLMTECFTSPREQANIPDKTAKTILIIADRSRSAILVGQIISPNGQLTSRSAIAPHL